MLKVWVFGRSPKSQSTRFSLYVEGFTFHVFMLIYDLEGLVRPISGLSKASISAYDLSNLSIFV